MNNNIQKYIQHLADQAPMYSYTEPQKVDKPTVQKALADNEEWKKEDDETKEQSISSEHLKEDHDEDDDDDDDHDDFNKYVFKSLNWCFKSSDDPEEVVECFQELIPVCRFNEKCKKRMQDFIDKHHIKMDIETGSMFAKDASYMKPGILDSKNIKGKPLVEFYLKYLQEDWYDLPSSNVNIYSYKVDMTTALDEKRTLDIIKRINQNYFSILYECKKFYKKLKGHGWDEDNLVSESEFIKGLKPILLYIYEDGTAQIRFEDTADFTSGHQVTVELSKNMMKPVSVDMEG